MRDFLQERLERAVRRASRSDAELYPGDAGVAVPRRRRQAAVLVPILHYSEAPSLLLTRRSDRLPEHPGQIAFPGGSLSPADPDSVAAALREAEEEVALAPECVEVIGRLDPYETITGYRVEPIVGLVTPPVDLRPDPAEVAELFEVPLDFVLDPANHQRHGRDYNGVRREFYAIVYKDRYIWGATAHMLVNLSEVLRGESACETSPEAER